MTKVAVIGALLCVSVLAVDFEKTIENSNFTLYAPLEGTGSSRLYNTDRFRLNAHIREGNWFATAIGDLKNILGRDTINSISYQSLSAVRSDTPFSTKSGTSNYTEGEVYAQLYRFYGGYADEKQRFTAGLQKVSMGVGRIWNPTDLFNPKNPLALEPDEVYGVYALSYTYSPSSLSQISAVAAERNDKRMKYAGRIKGYLGFADAAVNAVSADDVSMIGYELEGELFDTGVELRSEGGWFDDKLLSQQFFQGLIGADYAFENSLMLIGEWLHTSHTFERELLQRLPSGAPNNLVRSRDYAALSVGYQFDPLLYGTMSTIISADDGSFYTGPLLRYSLSDDMTLGVGAMFYGGANGTEFGAFGQTYYVHFKVTF